MSRVGSTISVKRVRHNHEYLSMTLHFRVSQSLSDKILEIQERLKKKWHYSPPLRGLANWYFTNLLDMLKNKERRRTFIASIKRDGTIIIKPLDEDILERLCRGGEP